MYKRQPYISGGKERAYLPDYLVRIRSEAGGTANLILEITGFNQDKELKRWAVRERWLPAVNNARRKLDLSAWHFAEITAIGNIKPELEAAVGRIVADLEESELMRDLLLIQSHTCLLYTSDRSD